MTASERGLACASISISEPYDTKAVFLSSLPCVDCEEGGVGKSCMTLKFIKDEYVE